jgi:Flp pilus assembly protein TadG
MSHNHTLQPYSSGIRTFWRDRRGGVAVMSGMAIVAILLAAGVAVDFLRGSAQRRELDAALDAAALAVGAASITDTEQLQDLVRKYLAINYNGLGFSVADLEISVEITDETVTIAAEQDMPTTLMKLASIDTMTIASYAEVTRHQPKTELVLVLDNTGSMDNGGKLEALKEAAGELTDVLFGDETESDTLKMAVVPFSTTVNVGPQYTDADWLDHNGLNPISHLNFVDSSKHNSWAWGQLANMDWNGCVEQRRVGTGIDYDIDDTTPDTANPDTLFPVYFAPDEPTDSNYASRQSGYGSGFVNSYLADWRSSESVTTSTKRSTSLDTRQRRYEKYVGTYASGDGPGALCTIAPITPLTGSKQTVADALENMIADGYTNIASGVGWGLRVLSSSVPFTEGAAYEDDDWQKVMVVMTDGENDWGSSLSNMNGSYYGGYGYPSQSATRLGMSSISDHDGVLDARTIAACNEVKAAGQSDNRITVYTITFGSIDNESREMMEDCASDSEKYFHAPDNATLQDVFEDIASSIKTIYLSK